MGGFASSRILEVHGERMIKRTFDPGFRIELHQKDLNLALSRRARKLGVALPNTAGAAQELFTGLRRHGGANWITRHGQGAGDDGRPHSRQLGEPWQHPLKETDSSQMLTSSGSTLTTAAGVHAAWPSKR